MAPFFTVLTQSNKRTAQIINTLTKFYAPPLVDGVSNCAQNYRDKYGSMNGRFFRFEADQLLMFDHESLGILEPQFLLSFDTGVKISTKNWTSIIKYLDAIFYDASLVDEMTVEFEKLVPKPVKIEPTEQPKTLVPEQRNDYEFAYFVDTENDLAICQVDKPFTDRPYTVIIRKFSERGLVHLFTSLYVSQSWGVASHDYAFLVTLWNHLGLEKDNGPLNLEQRLKNEIEKCKINPDLEPEMYRADIDHVKEILSKSRSRKHFLLE